MSGEDLISKVARYSDKNVILSKYAKLFLDCYKNYCIALGVKNNKYKTVALFDNLLELINKQAVEPFVFDIYHKRCIEPFDYYTFGIEFVRPLIDIENSKVINSHIVGKMESQIERKENVILFSNHQSETDPQIISVLLEDTHQKFAADIIFVAGERVIADLIAAPFSFGRNLLCIYSKRHIENPPEKKIDKQMHNKRTMNMMKKLLREGGKCIYVAPSGGRDRMNDKGYVEISPFDPQSIEMFYLISKEARRPTHFYPLSLSTYHLFPPPRNIENDIGEFREINYTSTHMAFGEEIDMEKLVNPCLNKFEKRQMRAEKIYDLVKEGYNKL